MIILIKDFKIIQQKMKMLPTLLQGIFQIKMLLINFLISGKILQVIIEI